jgi:hypothetical protein
VHSERALAEARSAVDAGSPAALAAGWSPPQLEFELRLELELEGSAAPAVARLRCALPAGYPAAAAARVSVAVEGLRRTRQDELTAALQARADALLGEEAVMELAQELQDIGPAVVAAERAGAAVAAAARDSAAAAPAPAPAFGRRWIVSHHLKNPTKRGNIVAWASELGLGGYSKPGHPGVVVVEGEAAACDEFYSWVRTRTGNWKNLALRGEVTADLCLAPDSGVASVAAAVDGMRKLPNEFEELPEDMGALGTLCKGCGQEVGDEFMEFVMQHRAGGGDHDSEPESESEPRWIAASASAKKALVSKENSEPLSTVLFHIDHMNDSATYIQKLQTWSAELKLGAVLLYRMRTKAVNASSGGKSVTPKGRAEEIWVLLG